MVLVKVAGWQRAHAIAAVIVLPLTMLFAKPTHEGADSISRLEMLAFAAFVFSCILHSCCGPNRVLAHAQWALRMLCIMQLAVAVPTASSRWHTFASSGRLYICLFAVTLYDQMAVYRAWPPWLVHTVGMVHGLLVGRVVLCCLEPSVITWHRLLLPWFALQVCMHLPRFVLQYFAGIWTSHTMDSEALAPASAQGSSSGSSMQEWQEITADAALVREDTSSGTLSDAPSLASTSGPGYSPGVRMGWDPIDLSGQLWRWLHRASSYSKDIDRLQAITSFRYHSRLGSIKKVCVKLDTHMSMDDVPYSRLLRGVQQAVQCMDGRQVQTITAVAARPGCLMLTFSLHTLPPPAGLDASGVGSTPASSSSTAPQLAGVILQQVQQALDANSSAAGCGNAVSGGPRHTVMDQAQVQIDDYMALARREGGSQTWQVQQLPACGTSAAGVLASHGDRMPARDAASSAQLASQATLQGPFATHSAQGQRHFTVSEPRSKPWLGAVCLLPEPTASLPTPAADAMTALAVDQHVVRVQLWGVSKAQTVTGWSPPPSGQQSQSGLSWAAYARVARTYAAAGLQQCQLQPATDMALRVLASFPWGYAHTRLLHLQHSNSSTSCATAEVLLEVPHSKLLQHHTNGPYNSLLACTLELWTSSEVLLSSSSVLAASSQTLPTPPLASAHSLTQLWWWGVQDRILAAAMSELQTYCQLLLDAADSQPTTRPQSATETTDQPRTLAVGTAAGRTDQKGLAVGTAGGLVHQGGLAQGNSSASTGHGAFAAGTAGYVQFVQDLQLWLCEVQRVACHQRLCGSELYRADTHDSQLLGVQQGIDEGHLPSASRGVSAAVGNMKEPCLTPTALWELKGGLHEYAEALGLQAVCDMLYSQQQFVLRAATLPPNRSAQLAWPAAMPHSVCRLVLQVLRGHECIQCEQQYQQQLHQVLLHVCVPVGLSLAAMTAMSVVRGLLQKEQWATAVVQAPWGMLHLAAVMVPWLQRAPATGAAPATSPGTAHPPTTLHSQHGCANHNAPISPAGDRPSCTHQHHLQGSSDNNAVGHSSIGNQQCAVPDRVRRRNSQLTAAWLSVAAYAWRLLMKLAILLGVVSSPKLSARLYSKPLPWIISHTVFSLYEQTRASMVLPAAHITQIVLLLDLPLTIIRALRERVDGAGYVMCLSTPCCVVLARMLLDFWVRLVAQRRAAHSQQCGVKTRCKLE